MNLFFDLDGTLIDSRKRLYFLFKELVPDCVLSLEDYWYLKRRKINHEFIVRKIYLSDYKIFEEKWFSNIEKNEYLDLDKPYDGVSEFLKYLKNLGHDIYLVTARQSLDSVVYQLNKFNWSSIFNDILVTKQKISKSDLITTLVDEKSKFENWFIGDTGVDIIEGKKAGCTCVAVCNGFLDKDILFSYQPDFLIDTILDLKKLLDSFD